MSEFNKQRLTLKCFIIGAVYGIGLSMMGPVIPHIRAELHVSMPVAGGLFTAVLIGFLVASLASGLLNTRIGLKRSIILAGFCMTAGFFLFPTFRQLPYLFISAGLIGLGGGTIQSLTSVLLTSMHPGTEGGVINASQVYFGAGAVAAPLLVRATESVAVWRLSFYVVAALSLVVVLFMLNELFPNSSTKSGEVLHRASKGPLLSVSFIALTLGMFLYTSTEISFWGWLPEYVSVNLGGSPDFAGFAPAMFWTLFIIGRIQTAKLTKRFGEAFVLKMASACTAVSLLVFYLATSPWSAMLLGGITALTMSAIWPTLVAYASIRFKSKASTALGIIIASGGFGGAIGPPLLGAAAETYGMKIAMLLLSLPMALIFLSVYISALNNEE